MKNLIQHLIKNNLDEIVSKSFLDCHCIGLHSIMLLECPGKTIRLYVADVGNAMCRNKFINYPNGTMSIAFHAHHCNLTLEVVKGIVYNWIVEKKPSNNMNIKARKFIYQSGISDQETRFKDTGEDVSLGTKDYQTLIAGDCVMMDAAEMHTVACENDGRITAWLVYEGIESKEYESVAYSNQDLTEQDFSGLYRKPTKNKVLAIIKSSGLI